MHTGGQFGSPDLVASPSGIPSDAELERAIQEILKDADLEVSTKRVIRGKIEEMYGMDLSSRKAFINAAIDRNLV